MTVGELFTLLDAYFEQGFSDCDVHVRNEAGDWTELRVTDVRYDDNMTPPVFKVGPHTND